MGNPSVLFCSFTCNGSVRANTLKCYSSEGCEWQKQRSAAHCAERGPARAAAEADRQRAICSNAHARHRATEVSTQRGKARERRGEESTLQDSNFY